ncbi:MAG: hypothetical protein D4R65_05480 [Verrucomicrobiaceae bacterium]|nr:MAG: hypothetical protein D4R65_05480 [Verrucomicrobiaceae bacterium]
MQINDTENPAPQPSALESAIQAIERSLRADGAGDGGIPDGELSGFAWRALFRWAERENRVSSPEITPERQGGREHDLTFLPEERRWRKFTKQDGCGFTVDFMSDNPLLLPGTPLQYLKRLLLQNTFWGDDTQLVGVQVQTPGARIITTQPDVKGEAPLPDVLHDYLCREFGFRRLNNTPMGYYKSLSYLQGHFAMFDVHPANFVQVASGQILPIDVIMIEFHGKELVALQQRLE